MSLGLEHSPDELEGRESSTSADPAHAVALPPGQRTRLGTSAEHGDAGIWLHESAEAAASVGDLGVEPAIVATVDERCEDEPGPHHPAEARRPAGDIAGVQVLMEMRIGGTLDGSRVIPGNGLRLAGGPRGKQDGDGIVRRTGHRREHIVFAEK